MADSQPIQTLPPSKRFNLLKPPRSSLPAKKRAHPDHHHLLLPSTSTCLPAKKRIWAPPPLSPLKTQQPPKTPQFQEEEEDDNDDGIICAVCRSTDGKPSDPIVFCEGCDLTVHASCYGKPLAEAVPAGDWYCLKCLDETDESSRSSCCCCLCPKRGGALKPTTTDGKWAHIVCGLLVPEVFFRDSEGRNGIDCSRVPRERMGLECCLCREISGCGVQCSEPRCGLAFHASCGVEDGLWVEYREGTKGRSGVVAGFCREHTKLWMKQQETGKFRIVAREEGLSSSKKKKARG